MSLGVLGFLVTGLGAGHAFATGAAGAGDAAGGTAAGGEAGAAAPPPPASGAEPASEPAAPPAGAPVVAAAAPTAGPKVGDFSISGYFRGGFGASNQRGRMTCFSLANPAGMISKYRLGNECEVWSETHFTVVAYAGDDGSVAQLHFMPTVYIPTTYIGYSPTGTVNSPAQYSTSTGAFLAFPNLYVDLKGVPWFFGGTAWMGTRYYKRESIYISDFFYWNPSGVGAGIEDIHLGSDLRLSFAMFAVDGEPGTPPDNTAPPLPNQVDFGARVDVQLRGIKPWPSGELQVGVQGIANLSNNPATHSGWGVTAQFVQKLLGGDSRTAVQYGVGGGTGFGTLARFYYPDFSVRHDLSEARLRLLELLTIQPVDWFGAQGAFVYQHDINFLGNSGLTTDWISTGARVSFAPLRHLKVLGELGYDRVAKSNGAPLQFLQKETVAVALTADRGLMSRPELRAFFTLASWSEAARTATVDSGMLYTNTKYLGGMIFGLQAETWF